MKKDIIEEYIKSGGKVEDTNELLELTNNLDFELDHIKTYTRSKDTTKRNTASLILPKNKEKQIYIMYTVNYYNNTSYKEAILEKHRLVKFGIRTKTINNVKTIDYIKGFIKIPNIGIYLFNKTINNEINIKFYEYSYAKEVFNGKLPIIINNLTFDRIDIEPTQETNIEFDTSTSPYEYINYIFRNTDLITNAFKKKTR